MPPRESRAHLEQVLTLIDRINHGAEWADATQRAASRRGARYYPKRSRKPRAAGFQVGPLAQGVPLVRVEVVPPDARLSALRSIAGQIACSILRKVLEPGETRRRRRCSNLSRLR